MVIENVDKPRLSAITQLGLLFAGDFVAPIDRCQPTTVDLAYMLLHEGRYPENNVLFHVKHDDDPARQCTAAQCEAFISLVIETAKRSRDTRLRLDTFYRLSFEPENCASDIKHKILKSSFYDGGFTKDQFVLWRQGEPLRTRERKQKFRDGKSRPHVFSPDPILY